jgi:tetratricopeptide (TPR) repeat protein
MNNTLRIFTLLMTFILLASGCSMMKREPVSHQDISEPYEDLLPENFFMKSPVPSTESSVSSKKEQEEHQGTASDDDNSYSLFLESQAQKKQGDLKQAIYLLEKAIEKDPKSIYLKRELALSYLQNDQNNKALSVVDDILNVDPNDVDALIVDASIRKALNKDEDVKPTYEKALQIDPKRKGIYQILGKMYLDNGDLDGADRIFQQMVQNFNNDYVGYYYLGKIYELKKDTKKAEEAFLKSLALSPTSMEPRLELIQIYQTTRQTQKLIAVYEEIHKQYPDNIPVAIELGLLYHKNFRVEAAETIFQELGKNSIDDPNVVKTVVQNLILQKRDQDAVIILKDMLKVAPDNGEIHYSIGVAYYNLGKYEPALQELQSVQPEAKFYMNAAIHMAIIYYKQKNIDKGIEVLKAAYDGSTDASKVDMIPYLVSLYREKGLIDEAKLIIAEGLAVDPKNIELIFELGVIYDKQGDTDEAIDQMKKVLDINPDHADALNYLGYTYADKGINLEEAEQMIRKALAQEPDNGYIIDSLGWVYYRKGQYTEATAYLERAVELVPDDPTILEHLGDLYLQMNKSDKAMEYFEKRLRKKMIINRRSKRRLNPLKKKVANKHAFVKKIYPLFRQSKIVGWTICVKTLQGNHFLCLGQGTLNPAFVLPLF